MSVDNVILWYEKNVNYKLTKTFLNFLIKLGIIKKEIDLELLNSFLLEAFNNEFIKENNKFKIKNNKIPVIEKFKDEKIKVKEEIVKNIPIITKKTEENKKQRNKFKIENLGGKKLKLVKL